VSTVNFAPLRAQGDAGLARWRRLAGRYGAERLLWGSNYPVSQEGSYADMVELGKRALPFLTDAERDLMMGDNAARVYPQLRGSGQ
jgi:predicted TIM-barrel fold metal-dependent hydrolase